MTQDTPETILDYALQYAAGGWPVFPCHYPTIDDTCSCGNEIQPERKEDRIEGVKYCTSPGKHPLTAHGFADATRDEKQIRAWWKRWPDANIGIPTGAISFIVLDVDPRHGGDESLRKLLVEHGGFEDVVSARTGSGGQHILFAHPGYKVSNNQNGKVGPGLDVRGDGGYIVVAPSMHICGAAYEWENPPNGHLPALPDWLDALMKRPKEKPESPPVEYRTNGKPVGEKYGLAALENEAAAVRAAQPGNRNNQLNDSAFKLGTLIGAGALMQHDVEAELFAAACSIGLGEDEARKTIASGMAAGKLEPRVMKERVVERPKIAAVRSIQDVRPTIPTALDVEPDYSNEVDPIAEAREFCASLPERLKEKPDSIYTESGAFDPQIIGALKLLKAEAPKVYQTAFDLLKANGARHGLLTSALKDPEPRIRLAQDAQAERKTAGQSIGDAPIPSLVVPPGYRITHGKTFASGFLGEETISHGALMVTGRTRDVDGDNEGQRLSWKRNGQWKHRIVDREIVATYSKLNSLAAYGFPVTSGNAKAQVDYFAKFEAENLSVLPLAQTTNSMGWVGDKGSLGFLVGRKFVDNEGVEFPAEIKADTIHWPENVVAFRGTGGGDDQIVDAYHREGEFDKWAAAVKLVSDYPRVMTTIYASFVPPLLDILGCPNFILDMWSRTSLGKSTTMRLAAAAWGEPDDRHPKSVVKKWNLTGVHVERSSALCSFLPTYLDDSKQVKGKPEEVEKVIYMVEGGRGRGRGSLVGLQATKTWRTVLISNGESPLTGFTKAGGAQMRVLEIAGAPFEGQSTDTAALVKDIDLAAYANYGHAGPEFVKWIIQNRKLWPVWKKEYQDSVAEFMGSDVGAGRLASYAGAIVTAGKLLHQALDMGFDFLDPVEPLWRDVSAVADDPTGSQRALRHILSWAWANENRFVGRESETRHGEPITPPSGWIGRWERGDKFKYIAFFPHLIREQLEKQEFNPDAIFTEWRDKGWIDVSESKNEKRFTKRMRIRLDDGSQEQPHMVVINRAAVNLMERTEEQVEAAE